MTSVLKVGQTLGGKYRVVRPIGEGGMGAVFEGEHAVTGKRVAIKWLHAEISRRPEAAARLVREAQASARVRHPNVVDVYDVEREGDAVFLVMELLEGQPLSQLLKERTLPMHQVIALLLPAMRGVAAAHKQGVVHRDIKPDNIFLAREDDALEPVPKVLDFGISKLDPRGSEQLSLTRTGGTVGTPLYMSYEQLSGVRDIDGRTDVYAFGVILYEALTGQPPFEASTYSELIVKVATQPPVPPKALRAEIPSSLGKIVLAAMAKDRDARISSMDALIRELVPFATEQGFRALMTRGDLAPGSELAGFVNLNAETLVRPASPAVRESAAQSGAPSVTAARSTMPQREVPRSNRQLVWAALGALALIGLGVLWQSSSTSESRLPATPPRAAAVPQPAGLVLPFKPMDTKRMDDLQAEPPTQVVEPNHDWTGEPPSQPIAAMPEPDAGKARHVPAARRRVRAEKDSNVDNDMKATLAAPPPAQLAPVPENADVPKPVPEGEYRVNQRPRDDEF